MKIVGIECMKLDKEAQDILTYYRKNFLNDMEKLVESFGIPSDVIQGEGNYSSFWSSLKQFENR